MRREIIILSLLFVCLAPAIADANTRTYPSVSELFTFTNSLTSTEGLTADQILIHDELSNLPFWNKLIIFIDGTDTNLDNPATFSWEFTNLTGAKCQGSRAPLEFAGPLQGGETHWPASIDISACSANGGYYFTKLGVILRTDNRGFGLPFEYNALTGQWERLIIGSSPVVKVTLEANPRIIGTVVGDSGRCGPVLGRYFTCDLTRFGALAECAGDDKSIKTVARLDSAKVFESNYSDNSKFLDESTIDVAQDKFCLTLRSSNLKGEGETCSDFTQCESGLCCAYDPAATKSQPGVCARPALVEGASTTQYQKDATGVTLATVPGKTGWTCGRATLSECSPTAGSSIQCGSKCCSGRTFTCCELNPLDSNSRDHAYCKGDPANTCN